MNNKNIQKVSIFRIIQEALSNIAKYSQADKVSIVLLTKDDTLYLAVEDNGIGISKEDAPKIFEPKFTTKSSGMGLGLPMIKNIVESSNGEISFKSELNKGATFTVTLPEN